MMPPKSIAKDPSAAVIPTVDNAQKKRMSWLWYAAAMAFAVGLVSFVLLVHPFLAVTQKVDADILVMEGWIPEYMAAPVVQEFKQGQYACVLVSGLQNDPDATLPSETTPQKNADRLKELGVPAGRVVFCPAPYARWLRTSKTAKTVQQKIADLGLKPKGINVITAGPHARETWVAYQHVFGSQMPVGIISVPKKNYPPDRWWLSRQGLVWVPKDFIAWLKEVIFGLRS